MDETIREGKSVDMKITFADRMQKGESSIFTILNEKKR